MFAPQAQIKIFTDGGFQMVENQNTEEPKTEEQQAGRSLPRREAKR